jgi:hypothetical protein
MQHEGGSNKNLKTSGSNTVIKNRFFTINRSKAIWESHKNARHHVIISTRIIN